MSAKRIGPFLTGIGALLLAKEARAQDTTCAGGATVTTTTVATPPGAPASTAVVKVEHNTPDQ